MTPRQRRSPFLCRLSDPGQHSIQLVASNGLTSNSHTFTAIAAAAEGQVVTATTNASGVALVTIPSVGTVPVSVTTQEGLPLKDALVAALPNAIAVESEGYEQTVVLTSPASLRARSLSLSGIVIQLRKSFCSGVGGESACSGKDLIPGVAAVCAIDDVVDALNRGVFACKDAPNLFGTSRQARIAQTLVNNAGTIIERLLAPLLKTFKKTQCAVAIYQESSAVTGIGLNDAYLALASKFYPELRGSQFVVADLGVEEVFTPFLCPVSTELEDRGSSSSGQWSGTLSWRDSNELFKKQEVKGWVGEGCSGAIAFEKNATAVNWARKFYEMTVARSIEPVSRSVSLTLPAGTYSWRVETIRLDGQTHLSDCRRMVTGTQAPPSPAPTYSLTVSKAGSGTGTVTSAPAGISCGSDCHESYAAGTTVTLTATAASGSTFAGWGGDSDCSDGSVSMITGRSCVAEFRIQSTPTPTRATLLPGQVLRIRFRLNPPFTSPGSPSPVTPDFFVVGLGLDIDTRGVISSGAPTVTFTLFDGQTRLGANTFTTVLPHIWIPAAYFKASEQGSPPGAVVVPFARIVDGSIDGVVEVQIDRGTLEFNLGAWPAGDVNVALMSSSSGGRPEWVTVISVEIR